MTHTHSGLVEDAVRELSQITGQLRAFFLKNFVDAPIAIVLDDRATLSFMRSISMQLNGWSDRCAVEKISINGIDFRFERRGK